MMGRYVDAEGTPLMEPDLTGQFRRMPVYLNLRVDQRFISDVLVNCANCPMPIDVLWIIVNPGATQDFEFVSATATKSGSFDGLSAGGSRPPRASGAGGGGSPVRSIGAGGSQGSASGGIGFGSNDVIIEIFGCINIFAPPDPQKIGGET